MSKISEAVFSDRKACELVGQFMSDWSFLEHQLNKGVQRLAGVENMEAVILTANMGVRDKINSLKTFLDLYSPTEDTRTAAVNIMNRVGNMSTARNTVAHSMFWAHEKGGVEFSVTKAKGRLHFPEVIWSEADFAEKSQAMRDLSRGVKAAVGVAATVKARATAKRVPNIFAMGLGALMTNPSTAALDPQAVRPLPPQGSPNSQPASPQTELQTPAAPPAKPKARKKSEKK